MSATLTSEQELKLKLYVATLKQELVDISVGRQLLNEVEVRRLTDAHRELCGVPKAQEFIVFKSPDLALSWNKNLTFENAIMSLEYRIFLKEVEFLQNELGAELGELRFLIELTKHVGWMWMSSTSTVVTQSLLPNPTKIGN